MLHPKPNSNPSSVLTSGAEIESASSLAGVKAKPSRVACGPALIRATAHDARPHTGPIARDLHVHPTTSLTRPHSFRDADPRRGRLRDPRQNARTGYQCPYHSCAAAQNDANHSCHGQPLA